MHFINALSRIIAQRHRHNTQMDKIEAGLQVDDQKGRKSAYFKKAFSRVVSVHFVGV
jgi:hypothetical protein